MKNLKKVLAIVVAMTMMLGTVGFAAYTDVDAEADIYTAVSTLSSLNILTGYEDGSFKPEGDITRAEFCAVVCRALGFNQEAAPTATAFTDVPAEHWASYYISTLADQQIVNGMGDGTFAPDANVTYEQAIKMLVVALGFEPMAAQKGGYPTGYLVVANTYEMTEGINAVQNAPATRGVVAQLTYNALDVPVMEQTSYGTENIWTVLDGSTYNNKESEYKTLLTKLNVAKIEGVVVETAQNGNLKKNEIEYSFHEDRVYGDKNWKSFINENLDWYEDDKGNIRYYETGTVNLTLADYIVDAADYLQLSSVIYLREISRGKYEVIAMMPGETGSTVELALEDIDKIKFADEEQKYDAIEYYPTASSTKTSKYKLDNGVYAYHNYKTTTFAKLVEDYFVDGDGNIIANKDVEIVLVENDGDGYYDAVMAKEYFYDIVKNVDLDRGFIEGNEYEIKFDLDDEDVATLIVDANGEEITVEDIAEGDVFAFVSNNDRGKNYDWIEFINLGESAVTGTVDEMDADNNVIYINSTEYGIATEKTLGLGDEATFYLTRTGKIFDFDKSASVASNYAYVLNAGFDDADFTSAWQLKLLTKDNEIVIYTVRDTVKFNGIDVEATEEAEGCEELDAFILDPEEDDAKDGTRVITYKLDSKNKIREINTFDPEEFTDEYSVDAQVLGAELEDNVVIFNITASKPENYVAKDISALVDEGDYEGFYIENEDKDAVACLVITVGGSLIDCTQDVAVIASTTKIKLDEGATDAIKVRYYVGESDELQTLTVIDDPDVTKLEGGTTLDMIQPGSLFMFTADAEGNVSAIAVLAYRVYDEEADKLTDVYEENDAAIAYAIADDDDNSFVCGTLEEINSANTGKRVTIDGKEVIIKNSANAYTYENRNGKTIITVGDWRANDVDVGEDVEEEYYMFVRLYNKTVKDVVTNSMSSEPLA